MQGELRAFLHRGIREHSVTSEALVWLCKERAGEWRELITPDLLGAILSALERDQHNENSRGSKLRDLLLDDRELIPDMFAGVESSVARDAMRRMMLTPVFDELTKRSLLARIIKLFPALESVITGEQKEEKSAALVVSWSSLDKRKAEYEELVNKKIPENSKEIGVARSYGDLRENFEFKAAKEMQAVLMRRKSSWKPRCTTPAARPSKIRTRRRFPSEQLSHSAIPLPAKRRFTRSSARGTAIRSAALFPIRPRSARRCSDIRSAKWSRSLKTIQAGSSPSFRLSRLQSM